ncbi:DUF1232 domain-containing protein [Pontibacter sp. BT327]|uniref:DUF1232 domain-containing protein n=2 Tax=Pontibacter burrus TaxID=2704466 RepID=A0A6B3LX32_9BACT|nr:DUF1232 domain-containing protein [Pontibacter burrus]
MRKWKELVRKLKEDIYTLYLASGDPRIPFMAKVVLVLTVAYAFSPIDLIPDFIPVLGYLDDMLLLPLGIWLSIKMLPDDTVHEYRQKARQQLERPQKTNYTMAIVIVAIWLLIGYGAYHMYISSFK